MIRTLHFSDFLKLGRLQEAEVGLNLPDSLVVSNSPLSSALMRRLPVHSLSSSLYIYKEAGKPEAFVQAAARRRSDEWNVLALGVLDSSGRPKNGELVRSSNDETDTTADVTEFLKATSEVQAVTPEREVAEVAEEKDEAVDKAETEEKVEWSPITDATELAWLKLLEYLVKDAGEKGVVRVYARLSTASPELSLFNQTGFHSYTHENLFTLSYGTAVERPVSLKIRPQRGKDGWFINELYRAISPSFVQNTEQNLARDWEIHKGYFPRPVKEQGWVLEEDGKVVAYIRTVSNRQKHMMRIMNLETQRELLPDLIRFALSTLKSGPDCCVYCSVREYQAEQEAVLEDAGFTFSGKQAVMVKHTVQFVRSTERVLTHARDRKLELAHSARPNLLLRLLAKLPFHYFSQNNY
ncbi:MAG: hypothetical protein WCS37_17715 [Chloroflexota bacterium]|nr:hypothetical protein [Chloroflexota bacterium]